MTQSSNAAQANPVSDEDTDVTSDGSGATAEEVVEATAPKKTRKKRVNKNPKPYPFRSKKQITEQIASDDGYCLSCLTVLYARQTASEQAKGTTESRNRQGFMSSHAVVGTKLAKQLAEEGTLEGEDLDSARAIVSRYGRQLAASERQAAIEADPAKAELAALFGAN